MRVVRTHSFRGRRYRIKFTADGLPRGYYGQCDPPTARHPTIVIRPGLSKQEKLYTIVHEAMHACYWDIAEVAIEGAADDIARLLLRLGYSDSHVKGDEDA